jgi:tetratricopeptide (TPR) repeat protein
MAVDLKNDSVQSALLSTQGDIQFYRGDFKAAKPAYDQALRAASKGTERDKVLIAKLNLARVAIAQGRSQSAIADLRAVIQQADNLNLKYFSLKGSVDMAEATINAKDYSRARQDLQRELTVSEKMGLRLETARIHYLLGNAIRLGGDAVGAVSEYSQTLRMLDDMKKEPGAEHLLDRSDLHAIYAEATRWFSGAKS